VQAGQAVSVALAEVSGLDVDDGLQVADSIAGAGLTIASKVLAAKLQTPSGMLVGASGLALKTPSQVDATTSNEVSDVSGHTHAVGTAMPAFTFSTDAAVGTAAGLVRADATLALFDATAPSTLSSSSVAATGSAGKAPRRDHVHGITAYSDMSAYKGHLAKSDAEGRGKWVSLTATEYLRTSLLDSEAATGLTIAPALDLYLSPGDTKRVRAASGVRLQAENYASQTTGWAIAYNGAADFRYVYTDELHAKAFIADLEQALAGGQIISKSVAPLSRDFTAPAAGATADLWVECFEGFPDQQVFAADDVVMLRTFNRAGGSLSITNCFGTVSAPYFPDPQSDPPEQRWTFTRLSGTVNGQPAAGSMGESAVLKRGALVLDFGTTGMGYHEVNAIDGAMGEYSPYAQNVFWTAHPWYDRTIATRDGNLRGIFNTAGEYGLYAGDGVAAADRFVRVSNEAIEAHNLPVHLYDGTDVTIALEPGSGTPSIAIGDPLPTGWLTQPGWWAGKDGAAYKQYVGFVSGGDLVRGAMWDGTNYHVRGNLIVGPGTGFVVEDALLHCPYDGTRPYETRFDVQLATHLGQAPSTATGGLIGRPGKFGKAVQLAEGTTNLIRNPSAETNISFWNFVGGGTSGTAERSAAAAWIGSYGLRWVLGSSPISGPYCYQTTGAAPTQGTTYTGQVRVRAVGSAIGKTALIGIGAIGGAQADQYAWVSTTLTGGWQWVSVSLTVADADRTNMLLRVGYSAGAVGGDELHIDAAQMEARGYATPYCDGSLGPGHAWTGTPHASTSTRTATILRYASAGLSGRRGTWAFWVATEHTAPGYWFILDARDGSNADAPLLSFIPGPKIRFYSNQSSRIEAPVTLMAGGYNHCALTYDYEDDKYYLYWNGVLVGQSTDALATPSWAPNVTVGVNYGGNGNWLNGYLDDLLILDRALTADEVRQIYESGRPITVTGSPMSLLLTGPGRGKVEGNASGLYGWDEGRNPAWALATEARTFGGASLGAGDVFMGNVAQNQYLHWDDSAGKLTVRGDVAVSGSVSVAWQDITNPPDGAGRLGTGTPGAKGLWLTGSHVGYYNGSSWPVDIGNDGTFYFSKDANNYVKYDGTTFEVAGKVKITDVSGFAGSGVLLVGTGTKDSNLNGWAIDSTEIVGQAGDGLDQVTLGTDGKIKAGGGNVILGGDGFRINALSKQDNKTTIRYVYTDDTVVGRIYTLHATSPLQTEGAFEIFGRSSDANLYIGAKGSTGKKGYIRLRAETDSQACDLILTASSTEQYVYASRRFRASDGIDVGTPGKTAGTGGAQVEKYIGVGIDYTPGTGNVDASGYVRGQKGLVLGDGVAAPTAASGIAFIYVDSADGDLKVKFGDGTTKTLATDT